MLLSPILLLKEQRNFFVPYKAEEILKDKGKISKWNVKYNYPVHLTPEAGAFFTLALSEQNFAFAKFSLASGAGDRAVGLDNMILRT